MAALWPYIYTKLLITETDGYVDFSIQNTFGLSSCQFFCLATAIFF